MKLTHRFPQLTPEKRPRDPNMDGTGLRSETIEHGGEYPDSGEHPDTGPHSFDQGPSEGEWLKRSTSSPRVRS
jgi:hypothetical protein